MYYATFMHDMYILMYVCIMYIPTYVYMMLMNCMITHISCMNVVRAHTRSHHVRKYIDN